MEPRAARCDAGDRNSRAKRRIRRESRAGRLAVMLTVAPADLRLRKRHPARARSITPAAGGMKRRLSLPRQLHALRRESRPLEPHTFHKETP